MSTSDREPLIDHNPALQSYYSSLESILGYKILLGDTRHFGYYDSPRSWPFKINVALRQMEERLLQAIALPKGSRVLDAGCGMGHVAIYMAKRGGLRVFGIDVIDRHIRKARRNIRTAGMQDMIDLKKMDYHHLDSLPPRSFDGAYTVETLVHAKRPEEVLSGFHRILRPGGVLVHYEYDHDDLKTSPKHHTDAMKQINIYAAMPTNDMFDHGVLESMLKAQGFEDVRCEDLSSNIVPMLWLFYVIAFIPYLFVRLFGLQAYFVNTMAGVESYRGRHGWRYLQVSARKPLKG